MSNLQVGQRVRVRKDAFNDIADYPYWWSRDHEGVIALTHIAEEGRTVYRVEVVDSDGDTGDVLCWREEIEVLQEVASSKEPSDGE